MNAPATERPGGRSVDGSSGTGSDRDRLRVLLWYWGRRGGGARYALDLASSLARRPDVELHLSIARGNELLGGFEALDRPALWVDTYSGLASAALATARIPALRRRFHDYLRTQRIDVVVSAMSHIWTPLFLGPLTRTGARYVPVVHDASVHPGDLFPMHAWSLRRELAHADQAVALSSHVHRQITALHGFPEHRIATIPHGAFRFGDEPPPPRAFPAERPFRFLFFGRILAYKGFDILLGAYEALKAEGLPVELAVAGRGDLGPHRERLARLGVTEVTNRWIREDEIGPLVGSADAVVLPYVEASQSGVIAAAYGVGVPVVVTPVGGLVEQVRPGQTGVIARAVTPDAVAEAMRRLLDPAVYTACTGSIRDALAAEGNGALLAERFVQTLRGADQGT